MQLRWTQEAADDLERITDYLLTHAPERALDLARTIYDAHTLLTFPNRGSAGRLRAEESSELAVITTATRRCFREEFQEDKIAKCLRKLGPMGWTRAEHDERSESGEAWRQAVAANSRSELAPRAGLEPATLRLTAGCSAIELPRNAGQAQDPRRARVDGRRRS